MEQGTLGKRIAYHRKRLGMTQEQLAQRVGVSAQAVTWYSCRTVSICPESAAYPYCLQAAARSSPDFPQKV